jgi:hypothetical protein
MSSPSNNPLQLTVTKRVIRGRLPNVYDAEEFSTPFSPENEPTLAGAPSYPLLQKSLNQAKDAKRNFSTSSMDSISGRTKNQTQGGFKTMMEYQNWVMERAKQHLIDRKKLVEQHLDAMEISMKILMEAKEKGVMDRKTWDSESATLEAKIRAAQLERSMIHRNMHGAVGKLADAMHNTRVHEVVTEAYLTSIMKTYQIDPAHSRKFWGSSKKERKKNEDKWKKAIRVYYQAEHPTDKNSLWCPITKQWVKSKKMKMAHIVPAAVGNLQADYIFGPAENQPEGHLFNVRNGIPIIDYIKEAFNKCQLIIVPALKENELQVVVLDEKWGKTEKGEYEAPNQGFSYEAFLDPAHPKRRILEFKHPKNRPALRYLYFNCYMSILRRCRHEVPGWQWDLKKLVNKNMWGFPGSGWIRGTMMAELARAIGHVHSIETYFGVKETELPVVNASSSQEDAGEESVRAEELAIIYDSRAEDRGIGGGD